MGSSTGRTLRLRLQGTDPVSAYGDLGNIIHQGQHYASLGLYTVVDSGAGSEHLLLISWLRSRGRVSGQGSRDEAGIWAGEQGQGDGEGQGDKSWGGEELLQQQSPGVLEYILKRCQTGWSPIFILVILG